MVSLQMILGFSMKFETKIHLSVCSQYSVQLDLQYSTLPGATFVQFWKQFLLQSTWADATIGLSTRNDAPTVTASWRLKFPRIALYANTVLSRRNTTSITAPLVESSLMTDDCGEGETGLCIKQPVISSRASEVKSRIYSNVLLCVGYRMTCWNPCNVKTCYLIFKKIFTGPL